MNSHSILVVFVVLFAKCLKLLTNARTPYALVHIWPRRLHFTTNWLLGVAVVLGPADMFTFTEMSRRAFIVLLVGHS